jgi:hypothetical protein
MAQRVTLLELRTVVDPLLTSDDFTALANRAVKRLYAKAATAGDVEIYHFGSDWYTATHDAAGGIEYPQYSLLLPAVYSHALKFKLLSSVHADVTAPSTADVVNAETLHVIPLESLFTNSGFDDKAFVDYGDVVDVGGRVYSLPSANYYTAQDGTITPKNIFALVRRDYVPVVEDTDTFPFDNTGALKLACLATEYEDENDVERAQLYWAMALQELDVESARYRGPQKINVSFYDEAAYDVTDMIN